MRIGLIAGSGLEQLYEDRIGRPTAVDTAYGHAPVFMLDADDREVVFLPRHGRGHSIPPHRINYRANIRALERLGCECVIATNAVGSMNPEMQPGDFVICDQFLDFTKQRPLTFFDGEEGQVRHVDVTDPYCPRLREHLAQTCRRSVGEEPHNTGTYVCAEGPRFETPAEIEMYTKLGGDVVGMTGVPEVVLAREAGLCYATVCIVSNAAAGMTGAQISHDEVIELMDERRPTLHKLLRAALETVEPDATCSCRSPFG